MKNHNSDTDAGSNNNKRSYAEIAAALLISAVGTGFLFNMPNFHSQLCIKGLLSYNLCDKCTIEYKFKINDKPVTSNGKPIDVPASQDVTFLIYDVEAKDPHLSYNKNPRLTQDLLYDWQYINNEGKRISLKGAPARGEQEYSLKTSNGASYFPITATISSPRCYPAELGSYRIIVKNDSTIDTKTNVQNSSESSIQFTKTFLTELTYNNPAKSEASLAKVYRDYLSSNYKTGISRYIYRNGRYVPESIREQDYLIHYLRWGIDYSPKSLQVELSSSDRAVVSALIQDTNPEANEIFKTKKYIHLVQNQGQLQVECVTNNPNDCRPVPAMQRPRAIPD